MPKEREFLDRIKNNDRAFLLIMMCALCAGDVTTNYLDNLNVLSFFVSNRDSFYDWIKERAQFYNPNVHVSNVAHGRIFFVSIGKGHIIKAIAKEWLDW